MRGEGRTFFPAARTGSVRAQGYRDVLRRSEEERERSLFYRGDRGDYEGFPGLSPGDGKDEDSGLNRAGRGMRFLLPLVTAPGHSFRAFLSGGAVVGMGIHTASGSFLWQKTPLAEPEPFPLPGKGKNKKECNPGELSGAAVLWFSCKISGEIARLLQGAQKGFHFPE